MKTLPRWICAPLALIAVGLFSSCSEKTLSGKGSKKTEDGIRVMGPGDPVQFLFDCTPTTFGIQLDAANDDQGDGLLDAADSPTLVEIYYTGSPASPPHREAFVTGEALRRPHVHKRIVGAKVTASTVHPLTGAPEHAPRGCPIKIGVPDLELDMRGVTGQQSTSSDERPSGDPVQFMKCTETTLTIKLLKAVPDIAAAPLVVEILYDSKPLSPDPHHVVFFVGEQEKTVARLSKGEPSAQARDRQNKPLGDVEPCSKE